MKELIFEEISQHEQAPEIEQPKRGRGRPKGSKTGAKKAPEGNEPELNFEDEIQALKNNAKKVQAPEASGAAAAVDVEAPEDVSPMANVVTGYMLLILCDAVIPSALCMLMNNARKKKGKKPLESTNLKLSKREREDLEPIADEVAKIILKGVDPVILFFGMMGAMYYSKITD
jgi:hypothetical protein